jgi:phage terminase large subunit-like protein
MIDTNVLMRRAVQWVCEDNNLKTDSLKMFDTYTRDKFMDLAIAVRDEMEFNQLKYFRPFEHQRKFFATGGSPRRGILAANRIGKTVSTCYETAYHLTGLYPSWWPKNGKRFSKPITVFVAGEGWEQVARVLQDELIGTKDVKIRDHIGTGAIPRDCIVQDTMRCDGANILGVEIKHSSGANSYLLFGNYTQEVRNLQGFKLDLCVFDEQPPDDVFSELVTRTATTQGQVLCSFTPLKGLNGLVSKFWYEEDGYEHVRVTWDDVPEMDPWGEPFLLFETRRQLERDYLPHEREARIAGVPVMGQGAVFQIRNWPTYKTGDYDFRMMNNIERVIALDLGLVRDKTVISLLYWNPREQEAWLHSQICVKGTEEAAPVNWIQHLMRPEVFGCPIVLPSDANTAGRYTMSALSLRQMFEEYNLNVVQHPAMNPPDSEGKMTNHKSFGINTMRQMMELGTFHINENCVEFLREAKNYFVDEKGRFSDPDDCIDSARYALLGALNKWSEPYDNKNARQRMAEARETIYNARARKEANVPQWKKPLETR